MLPVVVTVGEAPAQGELSYDVLRSTDPRPVPQLQDPEKLAVLLYTSGTSGRPRAAMLTHRALLANLAQVAEVEPPMIHGDDVVLGVLPLFHVYGLNAVLGSVLKHRAKLVLVDRFDPAGTLDLIEDQACSVVPIAPPVFALLAPRRQPRRAARVGAAGPLRFGPPVATEVIEEFNERTGIAVHQGYGLTEAAPVVTSTLVQRGAPERLGRRCPARHRDPARRRPRRAPPRGRTPARSGSGAPTSSAATGPTAPAVRMTTAGGPPATSGSSTDR